MARHSNLLKLQDLSDKDLCSLFSELEDAYLTTLDYVEDDKPVCPLCILILLLDFYPT